MAWDIDTQHRHRSTLHLDTVTALISPLICVGVWWWWRCVAAAQAVYSQSRLLPPLLCPAAELVTAQWAIVQVLTHDSWKGSVKLVTVVRMV